MAYKNRTTADEYHTLVDHLNSICILRGEDPIIRNLVTRFRMLSEELFPEDDDGDADE